MIAEQPVHLYEILRTSDNVHYEFMTDGGVMTTSYGPALGWYEITNVDTWRPRQGIGKLLLRSGLVHAYTLGAEAIVAGTSSQECITSMSEVYGPECLTVDQRGTYRSEQIGGPYNDAVASLYKPLGQINR